MNFAFAEGAKACRLLGRFDLFFLLLHAIELVDEFHNEEQADSDRNKIDYRLEKKTVGNLGCADHPLHVFIIVLLGDERKKRHYYAVDKRVDDCGERRADNHTNGKIDYIALERKGLEFIPHFLHNDFLPFRVICIHYITVFLCAHLITLF